MSLKSETQHAVISAATAGNNTLVAAVTGKKIRVLAVVLVASGGANTVRFESDADGTALTGQMDIVDNGQLILPLNGFGWFESDVVAELLNLELSAATTVEGCLVYQEIDDA